MHLVTAMKDPLTRRDPADGPAPDEKVLRAELRHAQEIRKGADARALLAAAAEARAAAALRDAEGEVARLEAQQQRASDIATEKHAKTAAAALRAGSPVPVATTLPDSMNTACLAAARAQQAVVKKALAELAAEHNAAKAEATAAAAAVGMKADVIVAFDAERLLREMVACLNLYRGIRDSINGLLELSEATHINFIPPTRQAEIGIQLNRQRAAIDEDPQFIENHLWEAHLMGLATAQKKRWADYRLRLLASADARLEDAPQ